MDFPSITIPLTGPSEILACRQQALQFAGADSLDGHRFAAALTELACAALPLSHTARVILRRRSTTILARIEGVQPDSLQRDLSALRSAVADPLALCLSDDAVTLTFAKAPRAEGTTPADPLAGLRTMNRDLLALQTADAAQQDEFLRLNTELEDTNRGVLALYAELDQRAEQLRAAGELKTRFLSNVSHEFRTPLNSIVALCRLLLDRADGPLLEEQERQVSYILASAGNLTDLVNDLLDLAKADAGRLEVHPRTVSLPELFGALRAVMRPLRQSDDVDLLFDEPPPGATLFIDDAKVSQILRNLVSNALKFTEHGEVRVQAVLTGDSCRITVADTGIGIAVADQDRVFDEFTQLPNPLQGKAKGTGLGLSLSRRLALLLGGTLTVSSEIGVGSTFTLTLPCRSPAQTGQQTEEPGGVQDVLSDEVREATDRRQPATDQKEDAG